MKKFAKVQTQSRELNQVQQNIDHIMQPLLKNPVVSGATLPNIVIVPGINNVPHGLGTMQQGWHFVDLQGPVTPYRSAPFNSQNLVLTNSGSVSVTASIYVF